jgi:TonB family protein
MSACTHGARVVAPAGPSAASSTILVKMTRMTILVMSTILAMLVIAADPPAGAHEPGEEETPSAPTTRTAPVLVERAEPTYPEAARAAGIGATVSLEIAVGADGSVSSVKVLRGAGLGFDEAAVAAAQRFRFKPATEGGKPIAAVILFDQGFVIRSHLSAETSAEAGAVPVAPTQPASPPEEATRYRSTVVDRGPMTAASSTTVRNLDFDLRPRTSPNDVLRVVPGLLAVQHQGGGKADQLFLRGFDADHGTDVGVYIDGVPVNMPSHAHGQGYADLHWLIPEALDRIDVIKGPYDARWGDFSTAGALNLITRKDFPESSAQYTIGGFPTQGCASFPGDCKVLATQRFVGIVAPHLGGWAERLHPWIAFEAASDAGPFDHPENLRRYNLFAKLSWDLSPSTSIGVFFQAYGSQWTGSGQIPQRLVAAGQLSPFGSLDPSEGGLTERQMVTLFLRHKAGDDELGATLYVTRYRLSLWNDFTFFLDDPVNGSELEQDDARVFTGLRADYHFHRRWRAISFRTTVGVEGRYDGIQASRWNAESCSVNGTPASACPKSDFRQRISPRVDSRPGDVGFSGSDDAIDQVNVAAFVEEDVVFNKYLRAVAALRADWFGFEVADGNQALATPAQLAGGTPFSAAGATSSSGTAQRALVSPKASVVGTPVPGLLDLYLNFGQGFHSNPAQVALVDGRKLQSADGTTTFTAHAVPRLWGGEIGARLHLWNRIDFAGAFWMSYLENETVFDADAAAFVPSAPTRRLGVDLELRAKILDWLYADFDLAQASATAVPDSGNGGAVALAPRLYMTGGLTVKHRSGVRAGLRFRYLGPRPAFDEDSPEYQLFTSKTLNGQPNPVYDPDAVTAQGYFVLDAYVAWRWRFVEVSLAAQNLLNSAWREAQFGNHSCTYDETWNAGNPSYAGVTLQGASGPIVVNRCGYKPGDAAWNATRNGVVDVHYTPGVPFNLLGTLKAYY